MIKYYINENKKQFMCWKGMNEANFGLNLNKNILL